MRLYCKEQERYVTLIDNPQLSIEADNQFVDLENYSVGNSFDISLVNEKANIEILSNNWYVILENNGSPLLRGRLIVQASTPTEIKCVFQGLPYCEAFKNFVFRDNLKDYFYETYYNDGMGLMKLQKYFEGKDNDKVSDMFNFIYPKVGSSLALYESNWYNQCECGFVSEVVNSKNSVIGLPTKRMEFKTHIVPIENFLQSLGIKLPSVTSEIRPYLFIPKKLHIKMMIKIRLFPQYTPDKELIKYHWWQGSGPSDRQSKILIQAIGKDVWDDSQPFYDATEGFHHSFWHHYNGTKSDEETMPFSCECDRLDLFYDSAQIPHAENLMQETYRTDYEGINKVEWGGLLRYTYHLDQPISYARKDDFCIWLPSVIGDDKRKATYVDAYLKVDDVITYADYAKDKKFLDDAVCPYNAIDFLDQSTNEFLTELTLNSNYARVLSNPLFVNHNNAKELHNFDYPYDKWTLKEEALVSIEKEIDVDKEDKIIVTTENNNYNSYCQKLLNNNEKTEKVVVQKNTTLMWRMNWLGVNMIPFNLTYTRDGDGYEDNSTLKSFLGLANSNLTRITDEKKKYEIYSDSTQYDYVKAYPSQKEKYIINCIGYPLTEYIEYEGQTFVVGHYRTTDLQQFELECYKIIS